jgi:predicted amidohydrolase YtcJ
MFADTIVCTTRLFTGLEPSARPGAFAVIGERIVAVGTLDRLQELRGPQTSLVDFGDAFVCAGLHDSHVHFFHSALYESPFALRYQGTSEQDCVDALAPLAARRPTGSWLLTQGWREAHWTPATTPSKQSLDAAYPDRPVAMYSGDAHTLWLNSCALSALEIDESSEAPAGGTYDKDAQGHLTGIVREAAAMALMPRIVASFSPDDLETAYRGFLRKLASQGITSVCDLSLMAAPGLDFVRDDIFASLLQQGQLTCRVNLFPTLLDDMSRLDDLQRAYTGTRLRACGFKQFFDGVSSQHTAWLAHPYANAHFDDDCGRPTIDPAHLRTLVLAAHNAGQAVRIHAIGDQAIHAALDIFEEARAQYGPLPAGRHHCLEHLENFQPDDIARLAQLDVVAAVQPMHITLDPGAPEADLGAARVPYMWPFATLLADGTTLAFGTDSPVCDTDPRCGLYTAITRKTIPEGMPAGGWLPEERIGNAEALRAYTLGSACACGRADELGTIETGKLADFAVFDTDLSACSADEVLKAGVVATWLGGEKVLENAS